MNIPLARPDITEAEYAGVRYAVAVNSGTSALPSDHSRSGYRQGDEVITASLCCLFLSCVL